MKPSARIEATIDLMERIAKSRVPMDRTCGDYFRARKYIGSKDRANIAERVYSIARAQARLGWWLTRAGLEDAARSRVIAWLALEESFEPDEAFDGGKHAPAALSREEKAFWLGVRGQKIDSDEMPAAVRVECPPEFEERLRARFGEDFEAEMTAMIAPATLDLRVNSVLADRDKTAKLLADDGVRTTSTPFSPWGLRCEDKAFLSHTKAFSKGWIDIQDEGSQLIALALGPKPGMQILDFCAGAGGKTLALAAAMQVKGRIVAMDTEEARLQKGRLRFRKAGVADIIEVRPLNDERHRKWLRRQKGTFDAVLCDVPCSGTGTWRRNPDTRWRVYGPSLAELTALQGEILDRIAHTLKPGGRLVYSTCSLLAEENEDQIEAFIRRHPSFQVLPLNEVWPSDLPAPCAGPFMRLTPLQHKTDGFFAAVLQKNPDIQNL